MKECVVERIQEGDMEVLDEVIVTIHKLMKNKRRRFTMEKVTLNVKGMSCGHCVKAVEGSVGELNGVSNVKVNLRKWNSRCEFNEEASNIRYN